MKDNKLIAEFMGNYHATFEDSVGLEYYDEDDMEYHTSWDWLMPVVEKIESLGYVFTIQGGKAEYGEMVSRTRCFIVNDKLSSTHQAVAEFIKAYNHEHRYICCSCGEHCSEYTYSEDRDSDECNDCKTYNDGQ